MWNRISVHPPPQCSSSFRTFSDGHFLQQQRTHFHWDRFNFSLGKVHIVALAVSLSFSCNDSPLWKAEYFYFLWKRVTLEFGCLLLLSASHLIRWRKMWLQASKYACILLALTQVSQPKINLCRELIFFTWFGRIWHNYLSLIMPLPFSFYTTGQPPSLSYWTKSLWIFWMDVWIKTIDTFCLVTETSTNNSSSTTTFLEKGYCIKSLW